MTTPSLPLKAAPGSALAAALVELRNDGDNEIQAKSDNHLIVGLEVMLNELKTL